MAARVKSQAGGTDDEAAPSIPSAFKNRLTLGATEAIMWIACRRHFSCETIREHLERRTLNLRRPNREPQVSPALQGRVDKAEFQLFRLIIGGVPAIGTLDDEGDPDHHKRIPVPVEFLKDGAYIELLSGHLRADPLLEKHSGYQRSTYHHVDIDRDAFFKALAAAEPRSQATDDKPIELADASTATNTPNPAVPTEVHKAESPPKDLTRAARSKGGKRSRHNPWLEEGIACIVDMLVVDGTLPTYPAVWNWLCANALPEHPYAFEPPISGCDFLYISGDELCFKDQNGNDKTMKQRALERYMPKLKGASG
jgi:hypothetical protein